VKVAQPCARIDAQFFGEDLGDLAVAVEGFGLAARPVQGEHPLAPEVLPEPVAVGQLAQLRDQVVVPAQLQVRVDVLVERGQASFDQAWHHLPLQQVGGDVGQRFAAPQPQRLGPQRRDPFRILVALACRTSASKRRRSRSSSAASSR
jgi:hypothetical protein